MASQTPLEDMMRSKVYVEIDEYCGNTDTFFQITEALKPTTLEIYNDSHLHSHHKAMAHSTSKETHFRFVQARILPGRVAN